MSVVALQADSSGRRGTRVLLSVGGLAVLVAAVYADSFVSMARLWGYSNYGHGVVVFPIAAFMLWTLRGALAATDLRPWAWGLPLLAVLVIVWFVGAATGVQVVEHAAAVALIPAMVAVCLGRDVARRALFPLLFLLAAVPFGEAAVPFLMEFTADVSTGLLRLAGTPVFRDGRYLSLPGGDFEIAEVCSGLRYLTAGGLLALLFSYMTYRSSLRRLTFVAATAIVLIVLNAVRAFIVMLVASGSSMRILAGRDHVFFGWLLFGVAMGFLFWIGARFGEPGRASGAETTNGASGQQRDTSIVAVVLGAAMLAVSAETFSAAGTTRLLAAIPAVALLFWMLKRFADRRAADVARDEPAASISVASISIVVAAVLVLFSGRALLVARASALDASPPVHTASVSVR